MKEYQYDFKLVSLWSIPIFIILFMMGIPFSIFALHVTQKVIGFEKNALLILPILALYWYLYWRFRSKMLITYNRRYVLTERNVIVEKQGRSYPISELKSLKIDSHSLIFDLLKIKFQSREKIKLFVTKQEVSDSNQLLEFLRQLDAHVQNYSNAKSEEYANSLKYVTGYLELRKNRQDHYY